MSESYGSKLLKRLQAAQKRNATQSDDPDTPPEGSSAEQPGTTSGEDHPPAQRTIKKTDSQNMPSVNPFTVEDLDAVDMPSSIPDLETTSTAEVMEFLQRLDEKMQDVMKDYAGGRINQATFEAVYTRYREQREIVTRLAKRHPSSNAWQKIATEGFTDYLRKRYSAEVLGMVIFDASSGGLIKRLGQFDVSTELLMSLLGNLGAGLDTVDDAMLTQIDDGRWLGLFGGEHSASVVLFSSEPARTTIAEVLRVHREFEERNAEPLAKDVIDPDKLDYPQAMLIAQR